MATPPLNPLVRPLTPRMPLCSGLAPTSLQLSVL